ncbi:unnamed protein product [Brachionus calyciflorus]|uniref:Uncharacterized protein n=1 Tax=Brachionus calyciflorus TaxID=104777 RepID=A0A813M6I8_9BILA|nr:unnamed protein product [Brachionus calyciflorus]
MAAEFFVSSFFDSKDETYYSFQSFFVKFFANKTPNKIKISYNDHDKYLLNKLRDAIVTNFYINQNINSIENFFRRDIQTIVDILQENSDNELHLARLLFLLHLTNSKLSKIELEILFQYPKGIELTSNLSNLENDLNRLKSHKIKENGIIRKTIQRISINNGYEINFNHLNDIKLKFFNSNQNLNVFGFAGINQIYINVSQIKILKDKLNNFNSEKQMNFIRLFFLSQVLNQIIHVLIRATKNELNIPSFNYLYQQKMNDLINLGLLEEKEIFKEKIEWNKSAESPCLNLSYLNFFYDQVFEKDILEDFCFDKSGLIIDNTFPKLMAISAIF